MILELFGYLGGDNRSHEIAEVYHWEMVQVSEYSGKTERVEANTAKLIEAYDLWCPMDRTSESDRRR